MLWTISILLIFLLQRQPLEGLNFAKFTGKRPEPIILCTELLKVRHKNYTLFMAVNKDLKNCKSDRSELNDLPELESLR